MVKLNDEDVGQICCKKIIKSISKWYKFPTAVIFAANAAPPAAPAIAPVPA